MGLLVVFFSLLANFFRSFYFPPAYTLAVVPTVKLGATMLRQIVLVIGQCSDFFGFCFWGHHFPKLDGESSSVPSPGLQGSAERDAFSKCRIISVYPTGVIEGF